MWLGKEYRYHWFIYSFPNHICIIHANLQINHYINFQTIAINFSFSLTQLDLSNYLFSGGISHFLCEVKNGKSGLTVLDLKKNSLSGEIPDCWMNYPNITYISLKSNKFIGSIPKPLFSLEYLSHLDLGRNRLSGSIALTL